MGNHRGSEAYAKRVNLSLVIGAIAVVVLGLNALIIVMR